MDIIHGNLIITQQDYEDYMEDILQDILLQRPEIENWFEENIYYL